MDPKPAGLEGFKIGFPTRCRAGVNHLDVCMGVTVLTLQKEERLSSTNPICSDQIGSNYGLGHRVLLFFPKKKLVDDGLESFPRSINFVTYSGKLSLTSAQKWDEPDLVFKSSLSLGREPG
jgi:hypothetical protein